MIVRNPQLFNFFDIGIFGIPTRPVQISKAKNSVCCDYIMHPSLEEELQQWMEDKRVSMTELNGPADRILK